MILLLFILFLQSTVQNKAVLDYRIMLGGMPINMFDVLTVVALLLSLRTSENRMQIDRVPAMLPWVCITLVAAGLGGAIMAAMNGFESRYFITATRDFLTLPAGVFIGYRLLQNPRSASIVAYWQVMLSLLSAILVLFFVRDTAAALSESVGRGLDELRSTNYSGDLGYTFLSLVLFAIVSRIRLFPWMLQLLAMGICVGATFLIPHRGAWVSLFVGVVFAVLILPRVKVSRRLKIFSLSVVGLVLVSIVAIAIVGRASGRDFEGYISQRLISLLPGEHEGGKGHAWDTRIPGTIRELELWARSPVVGRGFGIQEVDLQEHQEISYRHNTWTSFMAETGVLGLAGAIMLTAGPLVLGMKIVKRPVDRGTMFLGALGAIIGFGFFVDAFLSMTFNKQRAALTVGLWCGMTIRCRAMQLTMARQWRGYIDPAALEPVDIDAPAYAPSPYGAPAHAFHSSY